MIFFLITLLHETMKNTSDNEMIVTSSVNKILKGDEVLRKITKSINLIHRQFIQQLHSKAEMKTRETRNPFFY